MHSGLVSPAVVVDSGANSGEAVPHAAVFFLCLLQIAEVCGVYCLIRPADEFLP